MKNRLTWIKSPIRKKNTEHIPLQVYNTERIAPKRKCSVPAPPPPPHKLKLEIRVSVRISWENFNTNRVFSVFFKLILDIRVSVRISWENSHANLLFSLTETFFNNFHFQKIEGRGNPNPPSGSAPGVCVYVYIKNASNDTFLSNLFNLFNIQLNKCTHNK